MVRDQFSSWLHHLILLYVLFHSRSDLSGALASALFLDCSSCGGRCNIRIAKKDDRLRPSRKHCLANPPRIAVAHPAGKAQGL